MNRNVGSLFIALGLIAVGATPAQADTLDCTSGTCQSTGMQISFGGINYASFAGTLWTTEDATGSVVIDSFVRMSGNSEINDVMTTGKRPSVNDENPKVALSGFNGSVTTEYYEFLLDIGQTGSDPLLSMSQVNPDDPIAGAGDDGKNVLMNDTPNSGSGSGDLFMYIPTSYLNYESTNNKYVYLWSQFGLREDSTVRQDPGSSAPFNVPNVPEPASLLLLGSGLVVGSGFLRRLRKKAAIPKLT